MNDFCNTQTIMQMNPQAVPGKRYALEDADRIFFFFFFVDVTKQSLQRPLQCCHKPYNNVALSYSFIYFVNSLRTKDKNKECTCDKLGSEATNPKLD